MPRCSRPTARPSRRSGRAPFAPMRRRSAALLRAALGRWPGERGARGGRGAGAGGACGGGRTGSKGLRSSGFTGRPWRTSRGGGGRTRSGRGDWLAREVGVPVVWDFRTADVASGGEGAPLVPFFHFACARRIGAAAPLAFLNLGGVGNVTWVDPRAGGAGGGGGAGGLRHRARQRADRRFPGGCGCGRAFDADGAVAAAGRVDDGGAGGAGRASLPREDAAEVAGPAGFSRLPRPGGRALDRGRGGDAGGADGGLRRRGGAALPRAAGRAGWSAAAGGGTGR